MDLNRNDSPNNNNNNNDGRKPGGNRPKGSIGTALLITLAIVLLVNWIYGSVSKSQYTQTSFSDFLAAKDAGQLSEVEIQSDRIIYMTKEEAGKPAAMQKACYTGLPGGGDLIALSEELDAMGVKVETNIVVGRTITIDELMEENGFEAVFVGSGAGLPMFMHIPGENLKGVYSANEFLTRINLMKAYREDSDTPIMDLKGKKVAVVGGGNVAMDAARCSKRLGADVYVVYRRGMEELPARHEEVEHAIEEGVIFKTLNNPVQINGDEQDCVKSMTCVEMELGEPDASGRRRPVEKKGSEFELDVDAVIMSLGTTPNPLIKSTTKGLEVNKKGGIIVNEDGLTSRQGVYAGGDAVTGAATVILAMGAGKLGAKSIDEYLSNK